MNSEDFTNDIYAINELFKRSQQYRNSAEFVRFFNFIARFQHYSRYNAMLVYIQNPAVTFFGGATYWRTKFSRTIKNDAKPHIVLVPNGPVMMVYDIFDTIGFLTAEQFLEQGLGTSSSKVKGKMTKTVFSRISKKIISWGIQIIYKPLSYFTGGYFRRVSNGTLEICLKQGVNIEENFSVLIHELAHLFLGHVGNVTLHNTKRNKSILIGKKDISSGTQELEAEIISFLICKKIGLETRSAEYMASYITVEDDLLQFGYEQVIRTADKIESLFIK